MNPELILQQFTKPKKSFTGDIATKLKPHTNKTHDIWWVQDENGQGVKVKFKTSTALTIFEMSFLYTIYTKHLPKDYAYYHQCKAGQRFFDNIQSITLLEKSNQIISTKEIK